MFFFSHYSGIKQVVIAKETDFTHESRRYKAMRTFILLNYTGQFIR